MSNKKKSFLLHIDSLDILDDLTNGQAGVLFKAIKAYQHDEEFLLDSVVKIAFSPFKNQFFRDDEKYTETCKRRAIAGSKGGKQKVANASNSKQDLANLADTKNKNKNKTKNDLKDLSVITDGFDHWWNLYPSCRRKNKKGCLAKFKAKCKNLTDDQVEELVNTISIDVQKRISEADELKYIPMTEPYLNQERWNDGQ